MTVKYLFEDLHTTVNLVLQSNSNLGNQTGPSEVCAGFMAVY